MIAEVMRELIRVYIEPLLRFSGIFIDSNGNISPEGDTTSSYQFHDKALKVMSNDTEFDEARKNRDSIEIFSPFTNSTHMTFVANCVKDKLVDIYRDEDEDNEDIEGLDEGEMTEDEASEIYGLVAIFRVDLPDGRYSCFFQNVKTQDVYGEGIHENPAYAMLLMCFDAYNKHTRHIYPPFTDSDVAIEYIVESVAKWAALRKTQVKAGCYDDMDFTENYDPTQICDYDDGDYIYDEDQCDYIDSKCEEVDEFSNGSENSDEELSEEAETELAENLLMEGESRTDELEKPKTKKDIFTIDEDERFDDLDFS